ncbi:MAG: NADH:ubiquinone reductase (Na(+)-transporting) subunit C [Chlamydiia bacterium]|nr:NADH:ubiquinone reductase (Na(+)-transporting) subunit C [Chlamydiia bacterium]
MSSRKSYNNFQTLRFVVILSAVSATILSLLAAVLAKPKEIAKSLDQSKQMLIAAKIYDYKGYFTIRESEEKIVPAKFENQVLVPDGNPPFATSQEILDIYNIRIKPFLTNDKGEIKTFEELSIDETKYLEQYRKEGYYKQPWKLFYEILPNEPPSKLTKDSKPIGYVIPVNGYGLWDAIYGYLALEPNGDTVIGISWYDQKETPGLGANIAEPDWQSDFPGKLIFQPSPSGETDFKTAPLGITVVKGKVSEVYGDSPKAKSAVDGMAGATLTGNGVTDAYRNVLNAYRPFLIKVHSEVKK